MSKVTRPVSVAVLIYDGVYLLDVTGPIEVFNDVNLAEKEELIHVFTIAATRDLVTAHSGTLLVPNYCIDEKVMIDILVIPGGDRDIADKIPALKEWILSEAKRAEIILSVCTGSLILGKLGLLDYQRASTWYGALEDLQAISSRIIPDNSRITDNGKIITTGGITAGIDGSFYVVEKYFDREVAEETAKYMEWELRMFH